MFYGEKGSGKTSFARIIAKYVNCLEFDFDKLKPCGKCRSCKSFKADGTHEHPSIREYNGADANGVDDVRKLNQVCRNKPMLGNFNVYILDEIHQWSNSAQNAFLKTLEEPPPSAIFIVCTTDPQKLIEPLMSRLKKVKMNKVSPEECSNRLEVICEKEGIKLPKGGALKIADAVNGNPREAVELLETVQVMMEGNGGKISLDDLEKASSSYSAGNMWESLVDYLVYLYQGLATSAIIKIHNIEGSLPTMFSSYVAVQHKAAMFAATSDKLIPCLGKDVWKYKKVIAGVKSAMENVEDRAQFIYAMSDMLNDLITLTEKLKTYGMHNEQVLVSAFTLNQARRFKTLYPRKK